MEVGVFQGAQVGPRPWGDREAERIRNDVEVGVEAEAAGFDSFWAPEHHCLEEYSHCSASHLSVLAVGMRTQRIRLVTGIFNLCPPINHPVRVAEQIAMIDVLTHGRVELGTGRGSGSTEVNTFGVQADQTRDMWEEAIRAIPKMWTQELFSWEGRHFSVPERCILPKPVQKPHPPLWVTATNPDTVERAARMGIGVAMFNFSDPALLAPLVELYKKTIREAEPVGDFVHDRIMSISPALCLEDGQRARDLYGASAAHAAAPFSVFFDTIPQNAAKLADEPRPIPQRRLRELVARAQADPELSGPIALGEVDPDFLYRNGICVGDPHEVTRIAKRFEEAGFDELVVVPVVGWDIPHPTVVESLHTLGRHVLPALRTGGV